MEIITHKAPVFIATEDPNPMKTALNEVYDCEVCARDLAPEFNRA